MRRLLSVFCLFLGTYSFAGNPLKSRTRYYRHEISANIGVGTLNGKRWDTFREKMEDRFALSFKHGYAHTTTPLGIRLGLRYMYSFNNISIGGQFSYFSGSLYYDHYTKEESIEIAPQYFQD